MYARSFDKDRRPIQIPEHYSGSLFAESSSAKNGYEPNSFSSRVEKAPTFLTDKKLHESKLEHPCEDREKCLPSFEISNTVQSLAQKISDGLGFERLLILGLMLLLAGTEGSSELVLWLALLLFV